MTFIPTHASPEATKPATLAGYSLAVAMLSRIDAVTIIGWAITLLAASPAIYVMVKTIVADFRKKPQETNETVALERDLANAHCADLQHQLDAERAKHRK